MKMAKFTKSKLQIYQYDVIDRDAVENTSLGELIERLTKLHEKHGDDAHFEMDVDEDYGPCSGHTTITFRVSSTREETDAEYKQRETLHKTVEKHKREQMKKRKQERDEHDRKEFERLSKKFAK
jgi:hypothetical protein